MKHLEIRNIKLHQKQDGVSLVVTIVVLFALTLLALAATNTNQSQSLMVRNAQFRLEAFNASFAEIDAQVDFINKLQLSAGPPNYVVALIDSAVGTKVDDTTAVTLPVYAPAEVQDIEQDVAQTYEGRCRVPGQQVGVSAEKVICSQVKIDADSTIVDTTIDSNQNQIYEYRTLAK